MNGKKSFLDSSLRTDHDPSYFLQDKKRLSMSKLHKCVHLAKDSGTKSSILQDAAFKRLV